MVSCRVCPPFFAKQKNPPSSFAQAKRSAKRGMGAMRFFREAENRSGGMERFGRPRSGLTKHVRPNDSL
jgi:hypothetical protein